jgi:hypothetical protein
MAKIVLDDQDILDIVQLASRQETAEVSGEDIDNIEEGIVSRMSDEALSWYITHIIPIAGRKFTQEKWSKFRNKNSD